MTTHQVAAAKIDEALLMLGRALTLLDESGRSVAAARLDHVIELLRIERLGG